MPAIVSLWIWLCAYLNCAGWTLSALHQLNAPGYAVALLIPLAALVLWRKKTAPQFFPCLPWPKLRRRFVRPFPAAWLILAAMALLGGLLYAPSNYDGLAYRIPRVLHWLADGRWHWIQTVFPRVDTRACGIEWVSAPFIALLKTDRLLFLINIVSFFLLPGLVFSVFTRLGIRRRVAWHWMWIMPTGYCFLLQAGSVGNDLFGAIFALAAVDFALRARKSGSLNDFFASVLAAALMMSGKLTALPLLLPWALAILPSFKLAWRRPLATAAVCLVALPASPLITMVENVRHCGDWSGVSLEQSGQKKDVPLLIGANVVLITSDNLVPAVFPVAEKWNRLVERAIPPKLRARLDQAMEAPGNKFSVRGEMQIEENAGLGFGVSVLLILSVLGVVLARPGRTMPRPSVPGSLWLDWVRWSPAISLFVLMTQSNLSGPGRILTPYYALLLPILLAANGHEQMVKRRWWRLSALAVFLIAAGLLVVSPARPLFPVQTILNEAQARASGSRLAARMQAVYTVYQERHDAFAPVRAALPPGLKVLGLISFDDPETSLWRPFGSRRIEHVCPSDTPAELKLRGVEYILVKKEIVESCFKCSLEDWLKRMNAQVVQTISLNLRASAGPLDWSLVKLE